MDLITGYSDGEKGYAAHGSKPLPYSEKLDTFAKEAYADYVTQLKRDTPDATPTPEHEYIQNYRDGWIKQSRQRKKKS